LSYHRTVLTPAPVQSAGAAANSLPAETGTTAGRARAGAPIRRAARPAAYAPITATILTKNSEALIAPVLAALEWCDEVLVLDTGSTDSTLAIAATFANVNLHQLQEPFPGFGAAHRRAVELARHDWILSVDSDEIVLPALAAEIRSLRLEPRTIYAMPFRNFFRGKHITTCGWSPDAHERLFHRGSTNFSASAVHERVQTRGFAVRRLRHPIEHYSYRTVDDFLRKMASYARLFAEQNAGRKPSSTTKAFARSAWAFFKSYVLERGFLQGGEGLIISAYKSQTVFWKYLMLDEANRHGLT
jgi:glycosyltransferase involved in cell wall biosynthesis